MSLAFSFGSLGDILALTTLIKDLIEVLDDSRGSVSDYRVVVDRLRIQLKTVKRVDEVFGGPPKSTRDAEIQADVRQILRQIRACIDAFVVKLDKFGPNLTNGGSGNKLKDVLKKVNWRLDKKEIEAFETNLVAHTGLLDLHLGATAMDEIKSSRDQLSEQIAQNGDESKTALQAQSTSLRQLQAFLVALGRALLYKLNQVTQACQDIRHTVAQVFALGSAIQPKLDEILSKLEQVARPLEDLYFTLVDHLGIQRKIFLSNILSWDMFYDFLAIAYASELEPRSNTSRRFRLERILPDRIREHHIKPPWKTAFKPMQTVHLSIAHGPAYRSPDGRGRGPSCNSSIPRIFNQVFTKCMECGLLFSLTFDAHKFGHILPETAAKPQPRNQGDSGRDGGEVTDSSIDFIEERVSEQPRARLLEMPQRHDREPMYGGDGDGTVAMYVGDEDELAIRLPQTG